MLRGHECEQCREALKLLREIVDMTPEGEFISLKRSTVEWLTRFAEDNMPAAKDEVRA